MNLVVVVKRIVSFAFFFLVSMVFVEPVSASERYDVLYDFDFVGGDDGFVYDSESGFIDEIYYSVLVNNSAHVEENDPDVNFDGTNVMKVFEPPNPSSHNRKRTFVEIPDDPGNYLDIGREEYLSVVSTGYETVSVGACATFLESTVTWNNRPLIGGTISTRQLSISATWFPVTGFDYVGFKCSGTNCDAEIYGDEYSVWEQNRPRVFFKYDKAAVVDGMFTVQSNVTTEKFSLTKNLGSVFVNLNNGTRLTISYNTTTTHSIGVKLGSSYVEFVQEGNSEFGYRTSTVYLQRPERVDELEILGGLGEEEYFQLDNFEIENCTSCTYSSSPSGFESASVYLILFIIFATIGSGIVLFFVLRTYGERKRKNVEKKCRATGDMESEQCRVYVKKYGKIDGMHDL